MDAIMDVNLPELGWLDFGFWFKTLSKEIPAILSFSNNIGRNCKKEKNEKMTSESEKI